MFDDLSVADLLAEIEAEFYASIVDFGREPNEVRMMALYKELGDRLENTSI